MALGLFIYPVGHHIAGWRHPDASWRRMEGFSQYRDLVLSAERAKYDLVFLADGWGMINPSSNNNTAYVPPVAEFDPVVLHAGLATITSKIGLIATVSTTFHEPYQVARNFASLDLLSGGRAGWNVVTSTTAMELAHLRIDQMPPAELRYERAGEFAEIVFDLWRSLEPGALQFDHNSGQVIDFDKVHAQTYEGRHFHMRGPLDVAPSPQGRPITVQAGTSGPGIALAAKIADVVFAASPSKEMASAYYATLKSAVAQANRPPSSCLVMPGLMPIVGTSRQHANDIKAGYESLIDGELAKVVLQRILNRDLPPHIDLSAPPPVGFFTGENSRTGIMQQMADKNGLTTLDLARSVSFARGHNVVAGTAEDVADVMEDWFTSGCADGFNIMPASFMNGLNAFNYLVIPELQRRGLFRTEYQANTLRGNLNLHNANESE